MIRPLLAALAVCTSVNSSFAADQSRPNVVIVFADDMASGWTRSGSPAKSVARKPADSVIRWAASRTGSGRGASAARTGRVSARARRVGRIGERLYREYARTTTSALLFCSRGQRPRSAYRLDTQTGLTEAS